MKSKTNWTKVTLIVALALTSLSSTPVLAAMSAPHNVSECEQNSWAYLEQYRTAVEQVDVVDELSTDCAENASTRLERELAAIASPAGANAQAWMDYAMDLGRPTYAVNRAAERIAPAAGAAAQAWMDLAQSLADGGQ